MQTQVDNPRAALMGNPEQVAETLISYIDAIEMPATALHTRDFPESQHQLSEPGHYSASITLKDPDPHRFAEHDFSERVYVDIHKRTNDLAPTVTVSAKGHHVGDILREEGTKIASEITSRVWAKHSQLQQQELSTLSAAAEALPSTLKNVFSPAFVPTAESAQDGSMQHWEAGDLLDPRARPIVYHFQSGVAEPMHTRFEGEFRRLSSLALGPAQEVFHFEHAIHGAEGIASRSEFIAGKIGELRFQCERTPGEDTAHGRIWLAEGSLHRKFGLAALLGQQVSEEIFELVNS